MASVINSKYTTGGLNLNGDVYPISAWSTPTTTEYTGSTSHYSVPIEGYRQYSTDTTTPTQYVIAGLENYLYTPITYKPLYADTIANNYITAGVDYGLWNSTNVHYASFNPYYGYVEQPQGNLVGVEELYGNLAGGVQIQSSKDTKRQRLKSNLIVVKNSRANYNSDVSPNEQIALDTLREVVTEYEFRKYLKYGFVLVKGKSGDTYQIFRNKSHTKVWRDGRVVEEICVRIADITVPKTDNVVAFKAIIETDEVSFKKMGNVYKFKAA